MAGATPITLPRLEYAGGYDQVSLTIPEGAEYITVTLYYQGTSREYIEFLRDEIKGTATTLSSPTPSGEPDAYIVQSDIFFSRLKQWGDTIWDLWYHNHGLDGSGVPVAAIVPFVMTQASWGTEPVRPPADLGGTCGVDFVDFAILASYWLNDCIEPNTCGSANLDGTDGIDWSDLAAFSQSWLWGK